MVVNHGRGSDCGNNGRYRGGVRGEVVGFNWANDRADMIRGSEDEG